MSFLSCEEMLAAARSQMCIRDRGLDRAAAIADMRFHFIHQLVDQTVVKPRQRCV